MHGPRAWLVALVVAASAVAGAPSLAPPAPAGARGALEWEPCEGDAECAVLAVPVDDAVADGPTIDLALVRYRARDPERRIGSIVMNPGGPGGSGVDYVLSVGRWLPDPVVERFDVVGFDPRGVGASAGVDCTDDLDPYFDAEWAPDDARERSDLLEAVGELVERCEARAGAILPYLQTERTARDLDRIREALGDERLTYVGYSYGTYLGAWYAEQFPERVRALVLDGPIDPSLDARRVQVQQAVGFERSLEAFLASCAQDEGCAFRRDGRTADAYDRLRRRVGDRPLVVEDREEDRELNGTRFDLAVTQLLYEGRASWPELARSLDDADGGDGSGLLAYADFYTGRNPDGSYDDAQESFLAIGCADGPPVGDVGDMREIEEAAARQAPRLGRSIVNGSLACALWPVEAPEPRVLDGAGAPPLLVLGSRNDPATPFRWARGLASGLDSGVLVGVRGSHHTSFDAGNACVDDLVVRYLARREVPEPATRC